MSIFITGAGAIAISFSSASVKRRRSGLDSASRMFCSGSEISTTLPRSLPLYFLMYWSRSSAALAGVCDEARGANTGSPDTGPLVEADHASGAAASSE